MDTNEKSLAENWKIDKKKLRYIIKVRRNKKPRGTQMKAKPTKQTIEIRNLIKQLTNGKVKTLPPPTQTGLMISQYMADETASRRRKKLAEDRFYQLHQKVNQFLGEDSINGGNISQTMIPKSFQYELQIILTAFHAGRMSAHIQWVGMARRYPKVLDECL